jgi:hypothetical protein
MCAIVRMVMSDTVQPVTTTKLAKNIVTILTLKDMSILLTILSLSGCSFRTVVKHVASRHEKTNPVKDYHWDEMDFFIRCLDSGALTVFLFDAHESIRLDLSNNIASLTDLSPTMKMASIMLVLVESLVKMYDESVWTMRNVIRGIEKVGTTMLN